MQTFPTGLTKDQSTEALGERWLRHVTEPGTQAAENALGQPLAPLRLTPPYPSSSEKNHTPPQQFSSGYERSLLLCMSLNKYVYSVGRTEERVKSASSSELHEKLEREGLPETRLGTLPLHVLTKACHILS